ncbi:MAG TPA: alanine dehydrogenase [Proteobacteria bacterium]|nr:alanine dehydrogenase [Pseudomonadota bacterium]
MVLVQKGAGVGSRIPDEDYRRAGARIVSSAARVWKESEMILKVKEPLPEEYGYLRPDLILFTYLHLAANRELTLQLMRSGCKAIAYETIELPDGSLPLLRPMSEVAGRLAIQVGAHCLEAGQGGYGILLSGVSGVSPAKVVIIGAGVAGSNACRVAVGIGAQVTVLDIDQRKLAYLEDVYRGRLVTLMSNRANIEQSTSEADLLIGAVLIPGAKAPKLVTRDMVKNMKKGSVIVDISVDQGGCIETTRPTTHKQPTFIRYGVVHYCVANMPGIVPRTSTFALTNATMSYVLDIADKGFERAIAEDAALRKGVNVIDGKVTCKGVADAWGLEYHELVI